MNCCKKNLKVIATRRKEENDDCSEKTVLLINSKADNFLFLKERDPTNLKEKIHCPTKIIDSHSNAVINSYTFFSRSVKINIGVNQPVLTERMLICRKL